MRKLKASFFISVDGVVAEPQEWHFDWFDDEMGAAVGAGFEGVDAMLFGRINFEQWAAHWPNHRDDPFGEVINTMKKYVLTDTLTSVEWENSEIIPGGTAAATIAQLKAGPGGDIAMSGSPTTVRWLLHMGLLDELNLMVHPLTVGGGKLRLFEGDEPGAKLKLLDGQVFGSGVLNLTYAPA